MIHEHTQLIHKYLSNSDIIISVSLILYQVSTKARVFDYDKIINIKF